MIRTLQTSLILGFAVLFGASPIAGASPLVQSFSALMAPAVRVQAEEPVADKREVVKELLGQLVKHTKKKGREDLEAIAVIDLLFGEFEASGPKDRMAIAKALQKSVVLKRKEVDGVLDVRVAMAAAVALGEMGPESVKPLTVLVTGKKLRAKAMLYRRTILSLGQTGDPRAVKPLMGLIADKAPIVQGAAIEALGSFAHEPQDTRKTVVEALLKLILPIKSIVDTDSSDIEIRKRYDVIGPPTVTTLQRLSGQKLRDFLEWQRWWNKNKRKDWAA